MSTDSQAGGDKPLPVWAYLVGDIHGCYQEFLELEARIQQHAAQNQAKPLIVSVGDLVDRGPDSAGVVAHFFKGEQHGSHRAILGNHELMMLQALHALAPWNFEQEGCAWPLRLWTLAELHSWGEGMARYLNWDDYLIMMKSLWMGQGGFQTLTSYGMNPEDPSSWQFSPMVLEYLLKLPLYWEEDKVVVTHALAQPEDLNLVRAAEAGETQLTKEALLNLKRSANSLLWNRTLPGSRPDKQRQHVSGHTPIPRIRRWKLLQCVQIDTGCVYGRRLTAYCVPLNQSLSVPAQRNYLAPAAAV